MTETTTSTTTQPEQHAFSAEVGRLLDLVVHSLYSEREIFLRELVANAADATDRRRFEALTNAALALPEDAKLRIVPDKEARTILIEDNGVGMDKGELVANLGTIARSGTRAFGEAIPKDGDEKDKVSLIGQFGVGFYAAFMVADRVEVTSRRAGSDEAWTWASEGGGSFTLAPGERAEPGTSILLHMKEDAGEFLEPIRLETIVRKWADHITIPIVIATDGEGQAGQRGHGAVAQVEVRGDGGTVIKSSTITSRMRGTSRGRRCIGGPRARSSIRRCCSSPGSRPFDAVEGQRDSRVRLHVRRMFITDDAGLLPPWARFVQGVVDTEDLPLNVSREMLQTTPVLARIRKAVTNRVLSELKTRSADKEKLREVLDRVRAGAEGRCLGRRGASGGSGRADAVQKFGASGRRWLGLDQSWPTT